MLNLFSLNNITVVLCIIMYLLGLFGGYSYGKMRGRRELYYDFLRVLAIFMQGKHTEGDN